MLFEGAFKPMEEPPHGAFIPYGAERQEKHDKNSPRVKNQPDFSTVSLLSWVCLMNHIVKMNENNILINHFAL